MNAFKKKPRTTDPTLDSVEHLEQNAPGTDLRSDADMNSDEITALRAQVSELQERAAQSQDRERRAFADYQNLVRRTKEDTSRMAKFATRELLEELIQPLEHLRLASEQLTDPGLTMVVTQLWQVLEQNGVQILNPIGQEFSVETMEAVDQDGDGTTVTQVVSRGYLLNGEVLRHAKVVVGS